MFFARSRTGGIVPIQYGRASGGPFINTVRALIGTEARALMNLGKAGSDFWAPVVNLARDGRWGRNIESESPRYHRLRHRYHSFQPPSVC